MLGTFLVSCISVKGCYRTIVVRGIWNGTTFCDVEGMCGVCRSSVFGLCVCVARKRRFSRAEGRAEGRKKMGGFLGLYVCWF